MENETIKQLEMSDADHYFNELWNTDFTERFTSQQFINFIKEDENSFRELAGELRKFV